MDWDHPLPGFRYVLLDRTDPPLNARRYYLVGWTATLFDEHAVICLYGRKGSSQRVRSYTFNSLDAAWPLIRATVKTRLRHGYHVIALEVDRP